MSAVENTKIDPSDSPCSECAFTLAPLDVKTKCLIDRVIIDAGIFASDFDEHEFDALQNIEMVALQMFHSASGGAIVLLGMDDVLVLEEPSRWFLHNA